MYDIIKEFFMTVEPGLHEVFEFIEKYLDFLTWAQLKNPHRSVRIFIFRRKKAERIFRSAFWFYFAYSTALVSRMTWTLIWPG